jgi:hypothetical protein
VRLRREPECEEALATAVRELGGGGEALEQAIDAEQVGPLLQRALGDRGIVPPALAAVLRDSYYRTARRNLLLLREFGTCLRALAAHGVPVIVLKGAALVETVYGNVSLRPMGDVDVLVRRADLPAARRTLEGLDYTLAGIETHRGALAEYENELTFRKPGQPDTFVDVHWSLFDSPYYQARIGMDWSGTPHARFHRRSAGAILGPEADHPLVATWPCITWRPDCCVARHRGGARFYRDAIDWSVLLSRTREYGLAPPVRMVLTHVVDDWGAPMPLEALRSLRALPDSPEELRVFAQLTAPSSGPPGRVLGRSEQHGRWRRRLRFARTHLFRQRPTCDGATATSPTVAPRSTTISVAPRRARSSLTAPHMPPADPRSRQSDARRPESGQGPGRRRIVGPGAWWYTRCRMNSCAQTNAQLSCSCTRWLLRH